MPKLTQPVGPRDHTDGPEDAPVTLVEYGDYECPNCGEAYPIVKEVQRLMGNQLRFVFRNFPLIQSHPHAGQAAEAAEAAGLQGKYWEMHDLLFEHQDAQEDEDLRGYARQLGLDLPRFDRDLSEHTQAERIREDVLSGARSGVNGTPTFFINGERHDLPYDLNFLLRAVQEAVAV